MFALLVSVQQYANGLRFVLMALGGMLAVLGSKYIGYPSAGALGCITIAFVAGIGWRQRATHLTAKQSGSVEYVSN